MKDSDFVRINTGELTRPARSGVYRLKMDLWWIIDKDGKALIYKGSSIQANSDPLLNTQLISSKDHPGVNQILIERAYIPED